MSLSPDAILTLAHRHGLALNSVNCRGKEAQYLQLDLGGNIIIPKNQSARLWAEPISNLEIPGE